MNRLQLITKETKRIKKEVVVVEEDEGLPTLEKKASEEEYKMKIEKKTGVGYGTDTSTNQKWDITGQEEARKEQSGQILGLLTILEQFLDCPEFEYPVSIQE